MTNEAQTPDVDPNAPRSTEGVSLEDLLNPQNYKARVEPKQIFQISPTEPGGRRASTGEFARPGSAEVFIRLIPFSYRMKEPGFFDYTMSIPKDMTTDTKLYKSTASLEKAMDWHTANFADLAGRFVEAQDQLLYTGRKASADGRGPAKFKNFIREVSREDAEAALQAFDLSRQGSPAVPVSSEARSPETIIVGIINDAGGSVHYNDLRAAVMGSDSLKLVDGLAAGISRKTLLRDMVAAGTIQQDGDTYTVA